MQTVAGTDFVKLSTKTLWLAIYRVFEGRSVRIGSSLSLKSLMIDWADSGLRESDLAQGLESLAHAGFVQLEAGTAGPCARLLDDQFGILRPAMNDHQVLAWLERLRQTRQRPYAQINKPVRGRRAEDPMELTQPS